MLPVNIELEGEWEVAIVDIQYPFNWPNVPEVDIAVFASLSPNEENEKRFKEGCNRSAQIYLTDLDMMNFYQCVSQYLPNNNLFPTGIKLVKIPSGIYENPGQVAQMLCDQFNADNYESPNPIKIQSKFDPITKTVHFTREDILWFDLFSNCSTFFRFPWRIQFSDGWFV